MTLKYRVAELPPGFTPITKVISHYRAEVTINWFLTGTREPIFGTEIGSISNCRIYPTPTGDDA